ncbi:MAG: hypothetical protein ACK56W_24815 [Pirellula sp.]|nr:hypothetical protein [Pirellula sp.]
MEEREPANAVPQEARQGRAAPVGSLVPLDESEPANRAGTPIPNACGVCVARQLAQDRAEELPDGDRIRFRQG